MIIEWPHDATAQARVCLTRFHDLACARAAEQFDDHIALGHGSPDMLVKGRAGEPIVLLHTDAGQAVPMNQAFRCIEARYETRCAVGGQNTGVYAMVSAPRVAGGMCDEFIRQMFGIAQQIPPGASERASSISDRIELLAKMFAAARGAGARTPLGLFGEVFFIHWALVQHGSMAAVQLLNGWWKTPFDTSDFVVDGRRLEVKTTTAPARDHKVSAKQMELASETTLVSLVVSEAPVHGKTVADLAEEIKVGLRGVTDAALLQRLDLNIQAVTAMDQDSARYRRYDIDAATNNLIFIDLREAPAVPVTYQIDLARAKKSAILDPAQVLPFRGP